MSIHAARPMSQTRPISALRLCGSLVAALAAACAANEIDAPPSPPVSLRPAVHALTGAKIGPWQQTQALTAPEGASGDNYGLSVAISGDLAVVGAWHADVEIGGTTKGDAGAAYVYERNKASGTWTLTAKLTAADAGAGDSFGFAVACAGDTIAVGSFFADIVTPAGTTLNDAGAVYVFARRAGGWAQTDKIVAPDGAASDAFGFSIALSGDSLLIGAPYTDATLPAGPRIDVGAAYVYTRLAAGWALDSKLQARDAAASDFFGRAVALAGDTALIGAMYADPVTPAGVATDGGAAYIFSRADGRFTQQQRLVADDVATRDLFGFSVALAPSGDQALIGAYLADVPGGPTNNNAGAAYVFSRRGGLFAQHSKLTAPDATRDDYFGTSVAIDGDRALIGALYADIATPAGVKSNGGATYAFRLLDGTWRMQAKLSGADVEDRDVLGRSIALSADTALLAAPGKKIGSQPDAGAAYLFDYAPLSLGDPCTPTTGAIDCRSGYCSDGVCCDSLCGNGNESDCQSCRAAATGRAEGTCAPAQRATICRPRNPANSCDLDDVCDGVRLDCPARSSPEGTLCQRREFCGTCNARGLCETTRLCR